MSKNKIDMSTTEETLYDMKNHILNVSQSIMTVKGIKNTTLKDISKEAGISKGTLYYYYSAKDDIIYDIADRNLNQITSEILSWVENTADERLGREILETLFNKVLEAETRAKLHLYLLNEATTSNSKLHDKIKNRYKEWYESIKFGLDKIISKDKTKNSALSYLILSALDGLMIQKMCGIEDPPLKDIVTILLDEIV